MSSYEEKIVSILKKEQIPFQREESFQDLRFGLYRYDFFIPSLNILIEIQGEQHYKFNKKFYKNRQDFLKAQERDRKKISYALANGLKLYCIPFWDIDKVNSFEILTSQKYLADSMWKNDLDWKNYKKFYS